MADSRNARSSAPTRREFARVWRRFSCETAAGPIVEFAIIVPVLMVLLLGVIDVGYAMFKQSVLVGAAREGARTAAVLLNPCASFNTIRTAVRTAWNAPSDSVNVSVVVTPAAGVAPCSTRPDTISMFTVEASYTYQAINPAFRIVNQTGSYNLKARATYRWEYR